MPEPQSNWIWKIHFIWQSAGNFLRISLFHIWNRFRNSCARWQSIRVYGWVGCETNIKLEALLNNTQKTKWILSIYHENFIVRSSWHLLPERAVLVAPLLLAPSVLFLTLLICSKMMPSNILYSGWLDCFCCVCALDTIDFTQIELLETNGAKRTSLTRVNWEKGGGREKKGATREFEVEASKGKMEGGKERSQIRKDRKYREEREKGGH